MGSPKMFSQNPVEFGSKSFEGQMGEAILYKDKWAKPTPEEGESPIFSITRIG